MTNKRVQGEKEQQIWGHGGSKKTYWKKIYERKKPRIRSEKKKIKKAKMKKAKVRKKEDSQNVEDEVEGG